MMHKKQIVPVLAAVMLLAVLAAGCVKGGAGESPPPAPTSEAAEAPTPAVTPDPTPAPTLSGEPRPVLETYGIDPEEINELTYSFHPFGTRTLRRGEGGFDQVLALLASLKGAPVKAQRSVDRTLKLDSCSRPLFIGSDGERTYISLGWEDFLLLDTDGRPEDELEALFAAYAPEPYQAPFLFDGSAYRTDGGLSLTAAQPTYDYAALQAAIPASRRRYYEVDGGVPEEGAVVHLRAENQGEANTAYVWPGLLALRDGEWIHVPTFSPTASTLERRGLQPGESLETGLAMDLYNDPLTPGKYCGYMIYAVDDGKLGVYNRIAYAPFEIVGEVPEDGREPLMDGVRLEKVRRITYTLQSWDEYTLIKGQEGFDEALALLRSLRGASWGRRLEEIEIQCSRGFTLNTTQKVTLAFDGDWVFGKVDGGDWRLLELDGRPDQQLTNIFLRWGDKAPAAESVPADHAGLRAGESLSVSSEAPAYELEAMLAAMEAYLVRYREEGREAERSDEEFSVRFAFENRTEERINIEDYSLETLKDGEWYTVPFRRNTVSILPLQLEGGEKTAGFLSLLDVDGENLAPGRWRLCIRYGVGEDLSCDREAYAEFEIT
jgi:hypothetical protein